MSLQVCWKCSQSTEGLTATSFATLELPPSKHRWISAALRVADSSGDALILGDRRGSLHVYRVCLGSTHKTPSSTVGPVASYPAHGAHGVTCLKMRGDMVVSAGRNGLLRRYNLSSDGHLAELTNYKVSLGI